MAVEAGGQDDRVGLALAPVAHRDAGRADPRDRLRDQFHVGAHQGGIPLVRQHDSLAADLILRGHLPAEIGVADGALDLAPAERPEGSEQPALRSHRGGADVHEGECGHPINALNDRETREDALRPLGVLKVHLRHRPAGGALVDVQVLDDRLDRRDRLDCAAACADHRHPLARQVHIVAPASRVEDGTGELVEAGDGRHLRNRQLPAGRDQDVRLGRPGARLEPPALAVRVPLGPLNLCAGADGVEHAVAAGHLLDVLLNLRLARVAPRPARVRLERELIEMRGNVAGGTRVGVVLPDAAEALALLEDGDVPIAGPPQQDGGTDAAEAATHDRDRELPARRARAAAVAAAQVPRAHPAKTTASPRSGGCGPPVGTPGSDARECVSVSRSQPGCATR